jgi:hypothetical protein
MKIFDMRTDFMPQKLEKINQNVVLLKVDSDKGGQFGRRSRLVKVDFAFSLVKSEIQVAL